MARTIKARIQLKHDIEKNWDAATNFIPRSGEMIIYDPDSEHPNPRYKIGDDVRNPKALPFAVNPVDGTQVEIDIPSESGGGKQPITQVLKVQNTTINQHTTQINQVTKTANEAHTKSTTVSDFINNTLPGQLTSATNSAVASAKTYTDNHKAFHVGTSAPSKNNLLWIDTNPGQGLKYHDGASWVIVPVAWS